MNTWAALCFHRLRTSAKFHKLNKTNATIGLCVATAILFAGSVPAQTAHVSGVEFTLPFQGLNNPKQIAVDANGNIYIADSQNNRVLKETLSGGVYTQSTIASGLNNPLGVAIDVSGNVYIADSGNGQVLKETLSAGSYIPGTVASGLDTISGIAVDSGGNVFIADPNHSQVLKETPSGNSYTQSTIGTGFSTPNAVAVDANNNLYIADSQAFEIFKETPGSPSYTQTIVDSGLSSAPMGLAADASGNIYISAYGVTGDSTGSRIYKETLSSGSYLRTSVGEAAYHAGAPVMIAADATGNIYITASSSSLLEITSSITANFGTVNVTESSSKISFIFAFDSSGNIAPPAVLTQGIANLDFVDAGTGTCTTLGTTHFYSAGQTCTVDITFSPKMAGLRYGAVVISDLPGNFAFDGFLQGTGSGPQVNFLPATQTAMPLSSLYSPGAIAQDAAGNLYIAEAVTAGSAQNAVVKETWSGSGYVQSTLMTGVTLNYPIGVAVDGAGNVYVADEEQTTVYKLTPFGSRYGVSAPFNNLGTINGLAVDARGSVYISSLAYGIVKETPTGNSYVQTIVDRSVYPFGIAVDANGNVYFSDPNGQVHKETLSGTAYTQSTIDSETLSSAAQIATDGFGNVYRGGGNRVVKLTPYGDNYTTSTIANLAGAYFLSADSAGNVLVPGANQVLKIDSSDPPNLIFASTPYGVVSSDSPKAITLENIGNAALNFQVPSTGSNPSISSSFSLGSSSSSCPQLTTSSNSATLAPGASCLLQVSFQPSGLGPLSGSLSVTDNNTGPTSPGYATQTITLSGTGTQATPSINWPAPAGITYGTALSAAQLNATASVPGTFVYTPAAGTVLNAGPQTLSVTFTPTDTTYYTTATATMIVTVSAATPSIIWSTPAAITYGTALSATQLNATASVPGTFAYTPTLGTVLNAGVQTLSAKFTPTDTTHYTLVIAGTGIKVSPATPSLSFAPISNQVDGAAPFAVSAASPSAGALTYSVAGGPATISGNTVTLTGGLGVVILAANQAANGNYSAATATTSFSVVPAFTLSFGGTSSLTTRGGTAVYNFTMTPGVNTFPDALSFTATGLPTGATATFSPATIAAGSGTTTVTLSIKTSSQTSQNQSPFFGSRLAPLSLGFFLLPLVGLRSVRRKLPAIMGLAMFVVSLGIALGLSGCASGSNSQQSTTTTPQSYMVTVVAKDVSSGTQASVNLILLVQ